jgi:hypothetical protein
MVSPISRNLKAKPHSICTYKPIYAKERGFPSRESIQNGYGVRSRHGDTRKSATNPKWRNEPMVSPISLILKAKSHIYVPLNRSMRKKAAFPVKKRSKTATAAAVGTATLENLRRTQSGETNRWLLRLHSFLRQSRIRYVPLNRSMQKKSAFPVENRSRTATESGVGTATLEICHEPKLAKRTNS